MGPEQKERLRRVALAAVPMVLGAMAVKNIREARQTNHVSYWEASQLFIIDILRDGQQGATRLSGRVLHGPGGRKDLQDVELYEGFEYVDSEVDILEQAFPAEDEHL